MNGYKHYIRLNEDGNVIHGFSDAFDKPLEDDICIMEDGPRHFHEVWPEPLINGRGQFLFKWVSGERVDRTTEELEVEWGQRPPDPPSVEDRLRAAEDALTALLGL